MFTELRGWSVGISGLAFLGIGIGDDDYDLRCKTHTNDDRSAQARSSNWRSTTRGDDERCLYSSSAHSNWESCGLLGPAYPTSIHWAVSIAAGIPFGCGNGAVFIYASNYLVHSYGIYAASAMAGNCGHQKLPGEVHCPLAGPSMYRALGSQLGRYAAGVVGSDDCPDSHSSSISTGPRIRKRSALITEMRENEERQERREAKSTGEDETSGQC